MSEAAALGAVEAEAGCHICRQVQVTAAMPGAVVVVEEAAGDLPGLANAVATTVVARRHWICSKVTAAAVEGGHLGALQPPRAAVGATMARGRKLCLLFLSECMARRRWWLQWARIGTGLGRCV